MKTQLMLGWLAIALSARIYSMGDSVSPRTAILVELFTSEGCSSCPPADEWLRQLEASQPVPGAQIIVLSEHVDYWDHDGWKDPYSSHAVTERQSAYAHALGLSTVYTPQVIVDGADELQLRDAERTKRSLDKAASNLGIPVRISAVQVPNNAPGTMEMHVEVDGESAKHDADIFVAVALDHAESQVSKGENAGRHLSHVAVVESMERVGKLKRGAKFVADVHLTSKPEAEPSNLRIIAFVQERGPGRISGAALFQLRK